MKVKISWHCLFSDAEGWAEEQKELKTREAILNPREALLPALAASYRAILKQVKNKMGK